jgi:hypothetical protein
MNNEKYINYYIETLTASLNECIMRNLSLQANAKVTDDIINEQAKMIGELEGHRDNNISGEDIIFHEKNQRIQVLESQTVEKDRIINGINEELKRLGVVEQHYEIVKNEARHLEPTRNELVREREDHRNELSSLAITHENKILELTTTYENKVSELKNRLAELAKTPVKPKKKSDEVKNVPVVKKVNLSIVSSTDETSLEEVRDGGSF